ncbi:Hpt domain protein [Stieleria maiorica]|uniref:Hpt domain protein n=1 Tax=Stieleria maiorica TaxID=2795974 RepID=A0A5B9M4P5_9BACT|nr:Hpt domain-containing protein [Stieleria maiorica]QEF96208.1 Hpt domain protein [Stieleria maiorica]
MPKFDARIPLRFRLALLVTGLLAGTVLLADWIGLAPDARRQLMRGRVALCESLAACGTAMVAGGDAAGFESAVAALVDRNPSLRSVRLTDADGNTTFQTNGHERHWSARPEDHDWSITVPIFRFGQPWGSLQLAFTETETELGMASYGVWGLLAFLIPICLIQYALLIELILPPPKSPAENQPVSSDHDDTVRMQPQDTTVVVSAAESASIAATALCDGDSATTPPGHADGLPPIHTTLPIDDEEMRGIVVNFVDRLDGRLDGMQDALRQADFRTLRSEAHWLKGSGGTVGFSDFTDPARELENAAKDEDSRLALDILQQIRSIRSRIVSPVATDDAAVDQTPIECTLPLDDEDYLEIVVDFIQQLDVRLMGMLSMVQTKAFEELENEAHWLKGSGGTVGFPALTDAALKLMNAARSQDVHQCQESLRVVLEIRQRLVVPQPIGGTASPDDG